MNYAGNIYYWSPDYRSAVGGVKIFYRDVDILNANGYSAAVLHRHNGFRCDWFENSTRVEYMGKTKFTPDDYLVIPEVYGSLYADQASRPKARRIFKKMFETPAKKVMFNQNTYNTFKGQTFERDENNSIYNNKDIIATMVVSDNNRDYLQYAFPEMRTFRIHNSINEDMFSYNEDKKKQLCFMPRKNRDHALQVINFLKQRPELDDFDFIPIEGKTEQETATILKESLLFLSFGYPEGCPLPPSEAMACGCIVIGYTGMGGKEYFKPEFCYPVEMGDVLGFARQVEDVVQVYRKNPSELREKGQSASDYILKNYNKKREIEDVLSCWENIID